MISKPVKNINFNFKPSVFDNIRYWFSRKRQQIKKLIRYVPVIWKSFDFDYHYAIELFQMQLEDIATKMESDSAMALNSKPTAAKLRTAIRLMKKVYGDDDYGMEYQDRVKAKYGEHTWKFEELKDEKDESGEAMYEMIDYYDGKLETEEISKYNTKEFKISQEKQRKAHRILWKYIEHNIEHWWD